MQLSSDLVMYHPLWERADDELCSSNALGIFNRLVDVYVIACAIGIKEDKVIRDEDMEVSSSVVKTIGRNTHRENTDIRDLLDFMLQNAIIKSATIDFDEDERLKLAFNPDYVNKKLNAASFLTGFANYGLTKIFENITSTSSLIVENELYRYFESLANEQYDEIISKITLDSIDDI